MIWVSAPYPHHTCTIPALYQLHTCSVPAPYPLRTCSIPNHPSQWLQTSLLPLLTESQSRIDHLQFWYVKFGHPIQLNSEVQVSNLHFGFACFQRSSPKVNSTFLTPSPAISPKSFALLLNRLHKYFQIWQRILWQPVSFDVQTESAGWGFQVFQIIQIFRLCPPPPPWENVQFTNFAPTSGIWLRPKV